VFVVEMGRRHLAGIVVFVVHIFIFFYLLLYCRRDASVPFFLLPAGRRRSINFHFAKVRTFSDMGVSPLLVRGFFSVKC
jgi:hypothetical protein